MKIEFIANASVLVRFRDGRTVLVDPWLSDGIYYGSWYNFPPVRPEAIARYCGVKPDYIYISHLHPDHMDQVTLASYPTRTPVIIGALGHDHLRRAIAGIGFTDIRELPLDRVADFDGVSVCIISSFEGTGDGYIDQTAYVLDTSLWLRETDGRQVFHAVDNPMKPADGERLKRTFGSPDLAFLPYSGASLYPYPHAFPSYDAATKAQHRDRVKASRLHLFCSLANTLRPRVAVPCAGSYIMGGRIAHYSEYLHQATPDEIQTAWERSGPSGVVLRHLATGDVIDCDTGDVVENSDALFRRYTHEQRLSYALTLADRPLMHDLLMIPGGFTVPLERMLHKARAKLWDHQQRLRIFPPVDLELVVRPSPKVSALTRGLQYSFAFDREAGPALGNRAYLRFRIDATLLVMALIGAANWNNIEIGALVECDRKPDEHMPTLHSLMSFFML
jgi:UDP-MurNAc hydroxylase